MQKEVVIILLVLALVPLVSAECAPGWVYSRDVIGCIQAKCPPGAGRTYTDHCSCWVSEWGGTPKVTCYENQLATQCLPEGGDCSKATPTWDPVTGECKSGFSLNADKSACVAGGGESTTGTTGTSGTAGQTGTSGGVDTSGVSGPPPQSPPSQPQTPQQVCNARPNMQYSDGKCGCKEGYSLDLKRKGCVTPEQLETQCDLVLDAHYDPASKKCVCANPKKYASGYSFVCEDGPTYANQVCNDHYPGSVYSIKDKKCGCGPGTSKSPDRKSCITPGAIGNSCSDTKPCPSPAYRCTDGTCACAPTYRTSPDGTRCQTIEEYGNELCPKKFPGSVFDSANKKCSCPPGTSKSPDGKSCTNTEGGTGTNVSVTGTNTPCETTANCPDTSICDPATKTCKDVECPCGEVKNHACEKYACCDNTPCANDESCNTDSHTCAKINCPKGTIRDHQCNEGDCNGNDNNCAADKKCENNACVAVTCECGKIENHACTPYECCQDAQCTTADTECDKNQHKCVPAKICQDLLHSGDPSSKLDLVFVPDKYAAGDKAKFASDVQAIYNKFIDMEPFKSNKNKINVHRVDKFDENLACDYQRAPLDPDARENWRLLVCDNAKAEILASNCPKNNVMVVVNSAQYGGSGGAIAVSYNGNIAIGVLVHEFGHMLGLDDEYSYGVNSTTQSPRANCDNTNTCEKWKTVAGTTCNQKCSYENWYRSSAAGDIMLDNQNNMFFGTIAQNHITTVLGGYR